jgi:hypothetical protein
MNTGGERNMRIGGRTIAAVVLLAAFIPVIAAAVVPHDVLCMALVRLTSQPAWWVVCAVVVGGLSVGLAAVVVAVGRRALFA